MEFCGELGTTSPDVCVIPLVIQGEKHHEDANDTLGHGDLKSKVVLIYEPFSNDAFFDLLGEHVEYLATYEDESIFVIKTQSEFFLILVIRIYLFAGYVQGAEAEQHSYQDHAAGDYMSFVFLAAAAISAHEGV